MSMPRLYIKAKDLEESDVVKVFDDKGKEVYYLKDDFIATGHRIKIFLAGTISECGYVQEKDGGNGRLKFEFAARDKFGTVQRDWMSRFQKYDIAYDEDWVVKGDAVIWDYSVVTGSIEVMKVESKPYIIPGQALNMTDTYIIDVDSESDVLISLAFAFSLYALNKYQYQ